MEGESGTKVAAGAADGAIMAAMAEGLSGMNSALSEFLSLKEEAAKNGGLFGFLETDKNSYKKEEEYFKGRIGLAKEEYTALEGYRKLHSAGIKSLQAIETSAYKAMADQLLKLVEVHRFSVSELAKAIAQQVKTELVGLAAKASIWAVYETAMGLKDAALGLPTAELHFAAAKEFGVVAGTSLAAAAGVQALFGSDSEESSSSTSSSSTSSTSSSSTSSSSTSSTSTSEKTTQQITVNIYNPLSEQNWQKIVEDNIVPALNSAAEKNITVTVKG